MQAIIFLITEMSASHEAKFQHHYYAAWLQI